MKLIIDLDLLELIDDKTLSMQLERLLVRVQDATIDSKHITGIINFEAN
jgi:hypothetical protein